MVPGYCVPYCLLQKYLVKKGGCWRRETTTVVVLPVVLVNYIHVDMSTWEPNGALEGVFVRRLRNVFGGAAWAFMRKELTVEYRKAGISGLCLEMVWPNFAEQRCSSKAMQSKIISFFFSSETLNFFPRNVKHLWDKYLIVVPLVLNSLNWAPTQQWCFKCG